MVLDRVLGYVQRVGDLLIGQAAEYRRDDLNHLEWRNSMYAALIGEDEKTMAA